MRRTALLALFAAALLVPTATARAQALPEGKCPDNYTLQFGGPGSWPDRNRDGFYCERINKNGEKSYTDNNRGDDGELL